MSIFCIYPCHCLSSAGVLCSFSISIDLLEIILTRPGSPFTICWVFPNKSSSFNWNSLQQKQVPNLSTWFLPSHFSFFICIRTRTSTWHVLWALSPQKCIWTIYPSFKEDILVHLPIFSTLEHWFIVPFEMKAELFWYNVFCTFFDIAEKEFL